MIKNLPVFFLYSFTLGAMFGSFCTLAIMVML